MMEQAYQELRSAIVSNRIRPGEQLDTDSIGAALGCSRAPVVDALNILRVEGLVISRSRVGTFASEISRKQIEEVFDAREMIEQRVAPLVIHNISDRQIDALEDIIAEAASLFDVSKFETFDYASFMKLDALFHAEYIRHSDRKIYQKWFDGLSAHMQRLRHLFDDNAMERSMEGQKEHDSILAALRQRNVEQLRAELLNHTLRSRASSAQILATQNETS